MAINLNARTAAQANAQALNSITSVIRDHVPINGVHRGYICNIVPQIGANAHLHQNGISYMGMGAVVEVNTVFTNRGHGPYTLSLMLDVDIPPLNSTQAPHFGFEVQFNGTRVGNGHIWLPVGVIQEGRAAPGTQLETYGFNTSHLEDSNPLPQGLEMQVSFRRYK
ncbi:MAG: hypothetical protein M1814_005029 [Vezdaea aestivalis]|nr:MAG: hypothetical protein M1814_005029 [Vezdaea aestivalis]